MIRKFTLFMLLSTMVVAGMSVAIGSPPAAQADAAASSEVRSIMNEYSSASLNEFLELTPRKYREITGERLGLKKAIALKVAQKRVKKELKKADAADGDNQWVALALCWFFGALGVHRFYLGYTTIGIIQLLTLGGCGIWVLIDFIRIITGDLGPADGSGYDETI